MNEKNKEYFVFHRSYFEAIQDLKEKDRLKVYDAIFKLVFEEKEVELTGLPNTLFKLIKSQIYEEYGCTYEIDN